MRTWTSSCAAWFLAGALSVVTTSAHAQVVRTEIHPVSTVTLTEPEFLTGSSSGTPVTIAGELRLPRSPDRLPAVVLVHGSGGVGSNIGRWAQELNGAGFATFALDSFSGRGIMETATDQAQLSHVGMIVDAYRALARLAAHPRIDPARIAVMGFSKGGFVALYASLTRFQRMHGPSGLEFAAYVAFYPICIRTYIDDGQVSERPIRIFHGAADDWLPVAACRQYVERLRQAGKDIQLTEYAGAQHAFDSHTLPPTLRLPNVQAGPDCRLEERAGDRWCSVTRDSRSRLATLACDAARPLVTIRRRTGSPSPPSRRSSRRRSRRRPERTWSPPAQDGEIAEFKIDRIGHRRLHVRDPLTRRWEKGHVHGRRLHQSRGGQAPPAPARAVTTQDVEALAFFSAVALAVVVGIIAIVYQRGRLSDSVASTPMMPMR